MPHLESRDLILSVPWISRLHPVYCHTSESDTLRNKPMLLSFQ